MVQILWYSLSVKEIRTEEEQKNVHESSEMGTVGFERSRGADCGGGDFFGILCLFHIDVMDCDPAKTACVFAALSGSIWCTLLFRKY